LVSDSVQSITNQSNDCESDDKVSHRPLIQLDSDAEQELCILWDMSANEEVMIFLNDLKAIDLFQAIIVRTNCLRFAVINNNLSNLIIN